MPWRPWRQMSVLLHALFQLDAVPGGDIEVKRCTGVGARNEAGHGLDDGARALSVPSSSKDESDYDESNGE